LVLGLFLIAGFLFLNTTVTSAYTYTWTGGGDRGTWTDPGNWGNTGVGNYPGASTTDSVIIGAQTMGVTGGFSVVRATTTLAGSLDSITLGVFNQGGPTLILGNDITISASTTVVVVGTSTLKLGDGTWGSGALKLANGANNAIPLSIGGNATFTAATGTVTYTGGWNGGAPGNIIFIATTTFYTLNLSPTSTAAVTFKVATSSSATIGAGGGTFNSGVTFVVASGATLTANGTITATGVTWTNYGTVTRGANGKIVKASASQFDDGAGAAKSSFSGDDRNSVYVRVTDSSLNFNAAVAETQTATIVARSMIADTETVTLTETTVNSGIFSGGVTFGMSGTNVVGQLDYQGPGTLAFAYTDSQDSSDTGNGTGSFTGTAPGGGGSSSAATQTTTTTTVTPTTETTTVAPAATVTPMVTISVPTLESVQTKIASVIAKMATLSASPAASDLADVQAQIAVILTDIQAIQTTAVSQGVALGYNFVRPLALGMSHTDVSNLQTALKTDSSIYSGGKVTGYFGPATLLAIKKFQEKYGIVSEGQPGYGNVGPKTREKLNELYGAK
jgi:hypothetical protein